ncbi:MLO-like protein 4 [Rutidosis leptorrhynchoides]|uniref:MLO-like protein 4 n=1 Tax=Rutidosis leptorrhynchoides TaxID=125765 RepID=UPI003A98FCB3
MLFGVLSLLMGHWSIFIAKICIKSSLISSRFYPCAPKPDVGSSVEHIFLPNSDFLNYSVSRLKLQEKHITPNRYCPEGHESFASHESLEQMHRFVFLLAATHVSYSFIAIAFAMIKILSWKTWEIQAQNIAKKNLEKTPLEATNSSKMNRLSTFIVHRVSHPWSQHRILVWLLCFGRQFWSSINHSDYQALRLGFISTHQLPLAYDFHKYMVRSMEEEFRDIVGIGWPLWVFAIVCIFLNFHGTHIYFWISFVPAILILMIGTKLHRIVVKLAVEILERSPRLGHHHFNLRDELFWFGKPEFLLRLIQFISFQNAFEMASFLWSMWEIEEPSCYTENHWFGAIRLTFGIVSQIWCSFITFPLYVIVTQMGSRFKKSVIPENVRKSLYKWQSRVKTRQSTSSSSPLLRQSSTSSLVSSFLNLSRRDSLRKEGSRHATLTESFRTASSSHGSLREISSHNDEKSNNSFYSNYSGDDDDDNKQNRHKADRFHFPPP